MPIVSSEECENKGVLDTANLLVISARTAPKTGGVDDILAAVVCGREKETLAAEMDKMADEREIPGFKRDAQNTRDSEAVVLIGVRGTKKYGLDCGACGYPSCESFEKVTRRTGRDFEGPTCLYKAIDLGIALGSAVKTASILNIDNRIMFRIGTAAKRLNYMREASTIMGIPLSVSGKSIYFDRSR
ncbi:ferredoxin domain-containing protein [Chloroflexota bacterium]